MAESDRAGTSVATETSAVGEDPLGNQSIRVVTDADGCRQVIAELREHCDEYAVLGFDCEWVKLKDQKQNRVALLELASHRGLCALIRLNKIGEIPPELGEFLNDPSILKVGIDPFNDASLLQADHQVTVRSTLDLRHLACRGGHPELDGLAKLTEHFLGLKLDKKWQLRASNWEDDELDPKQIQYAANDAHVAVKLFQRLSDELNLGSQMDIQPIIDEFEGVFDQKYRRPKQKNKPSKK